MKFASLARLLRPRYLIPVGAIGAFVLVLLFGGNLKLGDFEFNKHPNGLPSLAQLEEERSRHKSELDAGHRRLKSVEENIENLKETLRQKDAEIAELQRRLATASDDQDIAFAMLEARIKRGSLKVASSTASDSDQLAYKALARVLFAINELHVSYRDASNAAIEESLRSFQRKNSLDPDGIVGKKTWASIRESWEAKVQS